MNDMDGGRTQLPKLMHLTRFAHSYQILPKTKVLPSLTSN